MKITKDNVLEVIAYIKMRRKYLDWKRVKAYEVPEWFRLNGKYWTDEIERANYQAIDARDFGYNVYFDACKPFNALVAELRAFKYCEHLIESIGSGNLAVSVFNDAIANCEDGEEIYIRNLTESLNINLIQLGGAAFLKTHPNIGVTKGKNVPFIYSVDGIFAGEPSRTLKQTLKFLKESKI